MVTCLLALADEAFPKSCLKKPLRIGMLLQILDCLRWNQADKLGELLLAHLGFLSGLGGVVLTAADAEDGPRLFWRRFFGLVDHSFHSEIIRVDNHRGL